MKRIVQGFIAVLLLVPLSAGAAIQWMASAITWAATAAGVTAAAIAGAVPITIAGAASLGFAAGVILINWDNGSGGVSGAPGGVGQLDVILRNDIPFQTPANWSPPPVGKQEPVPPNNISSVPWHASMHYSGVKSATGTIDNAVENIMFDEKTLAIQAGNPVSYYEWYTCSANATCFYIEYANGVIDNTTQIIADCPGGYDQDYVNPYNGCLMKRRNEVVKPSDGRCEISKVDGVFVYGIGDPDCSSTAIQGGGGSRVTVLAENSSVVVVSNGLTGTGVSTSFYDAGTGKTKLVMSTFDAGGILTAQVISYLDGLNLSGVGGTGTGTGTGSGGGSGLGSSNCGGAGQEPCAPAGFYSRTGTGTNNGAPGGIETVTFDKTGPMAELKKFTDGLGINLPAHSSQCPTGSFEAMGHTFTIDSHCQLVRDNFGLLSGVLHLMWIITGTFIVLRA